MVTTKINIDLAKKTTAPVVYAMQNDSDSRVVEAHLFVNGLPFDIGEASLSVLFQKPDGKGGWYDKLPDESNAIEAKDGNVVSAILAPQVLNVAGWVIAAIRADFADGGILSTFPFKIFVEKDPAFGGVESNDYFNVSNWAEVNEEISNIKESLSNALVLNENGFFDAGGKELQVGTLRIEPGLDTVGIILDAEVPEPVEGEKRPTGALSFYDSSYDRSVILRNIADGELDSDAATVGQLNKAVEGIEVEDGFSPTATVEETAEGAKITITDKNGTTTATIEKPSIYGGWELVKTFDSSTVDFVNNDVAQLNIPYSDLQYKELYVIGYITAKDTTSAKATFGVGKTGRSYWQYLFTTETPKYFRAHCYISPLNYMEVEGSMSEYYYTAAVAHKNGYVPEALEQRPDMPYIINAAEKIFWFKNNAAFGESTIIKVWGRK